jgi:hypothetical protein
LGIVYKLDKYFAAAADEQKPATRLFAADPVVARQPGGKLHSPGSGQQPLAGRAVGGNGIMP